MRNAACSVRSLVTSGAMDDPEHEPAQVEGTRPMAMQRPGGSIIASAVQTCWAQRFDAVCEVEGLFEIS